MIKDSGERREFDTGAVRDIQEGKGRCDLLPLDVVAELYEDANNGSDRIPKILFDIYEFQRDGDWRHLIRALREDVSGGTWADMILEVSKHFEEGAQKYGEYNWQKGIPLHCYIDSAVRHLLKTIRGDDDEPHARAFVWNIMCAIWTCEHKPELNEYGERMLDILDNLSNASD